MILCLVPDAEALSNPVHASARYYRVYLRHRKDIWCKITRMTLGKYGIKVSEPLAAIKTPRINFLDPRRMEKIELVLL